MANVRGGIYQIVNLSNGHQYIGSAARMNDRFSSHRHMLIAGSHHSRHLQRAWKKYGSEAFAFRPLIICAPAALILYEQRCIDHFRPEYNIAPVAGSTLGMKLPPEFGAQVSARQKGRKRLMSETHRVNHAAAAKTRRKPPPMTEEHRANLSAAMKGVPHGPMSEETKAKVSASRKGKCLGPRRPEVGRKISETHRLRGIKPSPDALERSAEVRRGKPLSEATRIKITAANPGKKRAPYKKRLAEIA